MQTPAVALAWELWRRHRLRLTAIIGIFLGFALLYSHLCSLAGFDPASQDGIAELARKLNPIMESPRSPLMFVQILYLLFLTMGPAVSLFLSLLCVLWIFTLLEFHPDRKDPMVYPERLFTLPVSTSYLFWWSLLGGTAAIAALYYSWVYFVGMPRLEVLGVYQSCLGWVALLALTQGIVWSLAAWPVTRFLALGVVFAGFLGMPGWRTIYESSLVMPALIVIGASLGRIGLGKMRHGEWQGWAGQLTLPKAFVTEKMPGPIQFSSASRALLWFEWRQFARIMLLFVALLAAVPVFHLVVRVVFGWGPMQDQTVAAFAIYLAAVPLLIHLCFVMGRKNQSFQMLRPVTTGDMTMAALKASSISTALSWLVVLAAMCALPFLGDFGAVIKSVSLFPGCAAALVIALIFLTWRLVAVNLWSARMPGGMALLPVLALWVGIIFFMLDHGGFLPHWSERVVPLIPGLLVCLLAVKMLAAAIAFCISLKRRLIARNAVVGYLAVWVLLVGLFETGAALLPRPPHEWVVPITVGIILIVPLARIGLAPIMMARARHEAGKV